MTKKRFGMILPITLLAYFLILMDNSIIFTSATEIGQSLHLTQASLSWISNAYTLTFGGFLLLSGRLSDLLGRKRIFLIGLTVFGLSSLMIGLSDNANVVIIMRAIQGIGSSIIAPSTLALMMDSYQGDMRERAIAYYGATAGIGSSLGLLIGGGLTTTFSWQAGFLINVPITLILLILSIYFVPNKKGNKTGIDYIGALLSVIGLAALIDGLTDNQLSIILSGIVILILFILFERRQKNPILPLALFKNRVRSGAYLARMLFMMAMLPYWFFLPQVWQSHYQFTAFQSGFAFMPLTIVQFVVSLFLGRLAKRFGNNSVLLVGEFLLLAGLSWTALTAVSAGYWLAFALPMVIIGIGQGLVLAPVTSAGLYKAPDSLAGIASGLTNTAHQIGGPIGLSLIVATTTSYHGEVNRMILFTAIALVVVATFVARKED
ncbi:MFS transporter [Fructobacillus fructosus]|uniref:Includes anhydromuropeptide permease AmpG (ProP) n=1 Tax=Fructobacillus fructosus TaxID=1631 RepID=A0ABN9Z359_9LACO|nr:MFS family permease [Fructobacillus fructosus]CAK1250129.1 MFS family permease [Fructobacillus fructosus]CAK1252332.1 MFS family permease [Fructobacillus fructosus]CAK1252457.1 MFS family permease [Fructobacillus fructosus]CAK1252577.1 MFS family permease [Fructobacillus fructosus]